MEIFSKKLVSSKELEKKIEFACSFNYAKCEFKQGRILRLEGTSVSFIELYRVKVSVKDKKILLLYFDRKNLFLYNRTMLITIRKFDTLLKSMYHSFIIINKN